MPYKLNLTIWTDENPQWTELKQLAEDIHTGKTLTEQYKLGYVDLKNCPDNVQRWFMKKLADAEYPNPDTTNH